MDNPTATPAMGLALLELSSTQMPPAPLARRSSIPTTDPAALLLATPLAVALDRSSFPRTHTNAFQAHSVIAVDEATVGIVAVDVVAVDREAIGVETVAEELLVEDVARSGTSCSAVITSPSGWGT